MPKEPLYNALQRVALRERLILYFEHERQRKSAYSIRALVEDIVYCNANASVTDTIEDKPFYEYEDLEKGAAESTRYDIDLPLKHTTMDKFLSRKSMPRSDETLQLIYRFLAEKGFFSPDVEDLFKWFPSGRLDRHFRGVAITDERLKKHRLYLEGEFISTHNYRDIEQLWIHATGRIGRFVTVTFKETSLPPGGKVTLKLLNALKRDVHPQSEGRIFMMPLGALCLTQICRQGQKKVHQHFVFDPGNTTANLKTIAFSDKIEFVRVSSESCDLFSRDSYEPGEFKKEKDVIEEGPHWDFRGPPPKIDLTTHDNLTPNNKDLLTAAEDGDVRAVIMALIDGADINIVGGPHHCTPTHIAAGMNHLDVVLALTITDETQVTNELAVSSSVRDILIDKYIPEIKDKPDVITKWEAACSKRNPLIVDNKWLNYPSSFAQTASDDTDRNKIAHKIISHLFCIEMEAYAAENKTSVFAYLDAWQPSKWMNEAVEKHGTRDIQRTNGTTGPGSEPS